MNQHKPTILIRRRRTPPIAYIALAFILGFGIFKGCHRHPDPLVGVASPVENRASSGERILIAANSNEDKIDGTKAFADRDYQLAIQYFQAALSNDRNDPEALIYLNNSIARAGSKKTVKIATVVPIGSNLNISHEILRGVAQAQTETNKRGGIQGAPLEVKILNDDNTPVLAREIAQKLITDPELLSVVGHNTTDASLAAAPLYDRAGIVMISPTSMGDNLSGIGKYISRTPPNSQALARTLAERIYTVDRHRKLALCFDSKSTDSSSFKDQLIAEFSKLGGAIVNYNCDVAASDFNPNQAIDRATSKGADALFIASHIDRLNLALQIAEANHGRLPLYSSPTLSTFQTLESGRAVAGLTLVTPWLYPLSSPPGSFSGRSQKLWGARVNWRTALSFDAAMAIATGLQHSTTRSGLQQILRSPQFSAVGATGEVKFLSNGDRAIVPTIAQIQQINGKWVFAPPPQPLAIPLAQPTTQQ
jgi:branched-chain amino acid transport system substrate-binding protein